MISDYLTPTANHVWQSTLFTAAVWLITLTLGKNRAEVRHRLWLAASVKFLIPFSLLAGIGNHFQGATASVTVPSPVAFAVEAISQPFAPADLFVASIPLAASSPQPSRVPAILAYVWLCGFVASVLWWSGHWWQLHRAVRRGTPLDIDVSIPVLVCRERLEPGVFGIFRPSLLLPDGITDRLSPAQLSTVVAHELCHVRRRDNLTSALHMFVEAVFWFHPLVWWIKVHLIREQERACDEAVLRLGGDPQVYAESILKICEFYLTSRSMCISGITSSNLKERIGNIMRNRIGLKLSLSKKALLAVVGLTALVVPITNGVVRPTASILQPPPARVAEGLAVALQAVPQSSNMPPTSTMVFPTNPALQFEAASIRPTNWVTRIDPNTTPTGCRGVDSRPDRRSDRPQVPLGRCIFLQSPLPGLIGRAYIGEEGVTGGPKWVWESSELFSIEAKAPDPSKATERDLYLMLQNLLANRFKLKLRREPKEISGYGLVLARNGPRLAAAKNTEVRPSVSARGGSGITTLYGQNASMTNLAGSLSVFGIGTVKDKTNLLGSYDFELTFANEPGMQSPKSGGPAQIAPGSGPSLFKALEEQLGLRLERQKLNVEYLVIESVERPSVN